MRKLKIAVGTRLSELKSELQAKFDLGSKVSMSYEDKDGDTVTLSSETGIVNFLSFRRYISFISFNFCSCQSGKSV